MNTTCSPPGVPGEITEFLAAIRPRGGVTELRALDLERPARRSESAYFPAERFADLAARAAELSAVRAARGVYVVLNPLNPVCIGRRGAASGKDVAEAAFLLLDIDPVKAYRAGPASQSESDAANKLADDVRAELADRYRWHPATDVFTGNGRQLAYPIPPDTTPEMRKRVLLALAREFDTPEAKIDTTTADSARMARLPGTLNRKGTATAERPHRAARLLSADTEAEAVSVAALVELAGPDPSPPAPSPFVLTVPTRDAAAKVRAYLANVPGAVSGDGGHPATYALACTLVQDFGLDPAAAKAHLLEWNRECSPPWPEKDLDHKLADAFEKATPRDGKPRGWMLAQAGPLPATAKAKPVPPTRSVPDRLPYPVDALPDGVRPVAETVARAVGCDVSLAALPLLAVTGAAAGAAVKIELKRGYAEPPALWMATASDSGTAKSPAARPALELAHALADDAEDEHAQAVADYERDVEAFVAAAKKWKELKANGDDPGEKPKPPPKPVKPYFVTTDTTTERLLTDLSDSPRGMVLLRDELVGFFGAMTRYANGGDDSPTYLSLFDSAPTTYRRKTGDPQYRDLRIKRPFLAVDGGIQPGVLARAVAKNVGMTDSGFLARFLVNYPPKLCPLWTDDEPDPVAILNLLEALRRLRKLPYNLRSGPFHIRPDAAALAVFSEFSNECMTAAQNLNGGGLAAALPKLSRHAARLALVHHCATAAMADRDPGRGCIGVESMAAGVALARWHRREAERLYAFLGMTEDEDERESDSLLALVKRKGGTLTARNLQRANEGKYPTADAAKLALDSLVTAGFGLWVQTGRTEEFRLHAAAGE